MTPILDRSPDPVVFLGPSLPRAEAESLLRAEFRPPIRRGDLETCGDAPVILIIDGEFAQSFPVSPKEILRSLDAGKVVVGAASMGALRASELASEGMIGIGWIYEAYRSGRIEGDDEVALSYCPLSFEPRTVPLVNVRGWLDRLEARALLTAAERSMILRRVRRVFYADRTPARLSLVVAECLGDDRQGEIARAGFGEIPDLKARDARTALSAVARMRNREPLQESRS